MEEIGSRASVFVLEGIQGQQEQYTDWLIGKCVKKGVARKDIFADDAMELLVERLVTPLQIEQHLILAFEEGYRIGQKPVTAEVINAILAKDTA